MYRKILSSMLALIVSTIVVHATSYAEGLSVGYYSGSTVIPPIKLLMGSRFDWLLLVSVTSITTATVST